MRNLLEWRRLQFILFDAEEHDTIEMNHSDINAEEIKLPKAKNRLKDMITQVPKSGPDYPQAQTKSTIDHDNSNSNYPSAKYGAGSTERNNQIMNPYDEQEGSREEDKEQQFVDDSDQGEGEGEGESDYDEDEIVAREHMPDVQEMHFNQTVAALFNIK